jgi:hypothetical protein
MKSRNAVLFAALCAVVMCCQGSWSADAEPVKDAKAEVKETEVYVTKSGEKYHCKDCRTITDKGATAIKLGEAKKKHQPCAVCKPDSLALVSEKGEKYHTKECKAAGKDAKEIELAAAQTQGLEACKLCHPEAKKDDKKDGGKEEKKADPAK